jgi:hypothetical protein
MKTILPLLLIASLGCTGCFNVASAIKAMGKDPATVHLRVSSVYGVLELSRTNPQTNSLAHSVAPDGTITVTIPPVVQKP